VAAADRAAAATSATERDQLQQKQKQPKGRVQATPQQPQQQTPRGEPLSAAMMMAGPATTVIPHSTERIYSIDLPTASASVSLLGESASGLTAECTNTRRAPLGSKQGGSSAISCIDLSISRGGPVVWRDEIPGAACTVTCASCDLWAVGTNDGVIQLYGTSPSVGWDSGEAFRSMAPLVLGQPIVELQLQTLEKEQEDDDEEMSPSVSSTLSKTVMFCVLSDGSFFVYNLSPDLCLLYKGSILPAMTHVSLGLPHEQHQQPLPPKLSKVQMTEKGHLLLLLSLQGSGRSASARAMPNDSSNRIRSLTHVEDHGAGGSIQGFVYNRALELWTRVADSRFVCSDFYKSLPSFSAKKKAMGPLSDMENSVRMGSLGSSLKPVRGRSPTGTEQKINVAKLPIIIEFKR
jgi:hypothetical protein